jgi:hypothetical protein
MGVLRRPPMEAKHFATVVAPRNTPFGIFRLGWRMRFSLFIPLKGELYNTIFGGKTFCKPW